MYCFVLFRDCVIEVVGLGLRLASQFQQEPFGAGVTPWKE